MADNPDSAISTSLRLTKALGLARQGKLLPAQQLLAPGSTIPSTTVELHALAALVTHEGDYERALRLWHLLLQRQPNHPEARRMIPMIELWLSRPSWHRFVPWGAALLTTGVLCGFLLWAFSAFQAPSPAAKPVSAPRPTQVTPAAPTPAPAPPPPTRAAPTKNQRPR